MFSIGMTLINQSSGKIVASESHKVNFNDVIGINLLDDYSDDCCWITLSLKNGDKKFGKFSYHNQQHKEHLELLRNLKPIVPSFSDGWTDGAVGGTYKYCQISE